MFFTCHSVSVGVIPAPEVFGVEEARPLSLTGVHFILETRELFLFVVVGVIHDARVTFEVVEAEFEVEEVVVVFFGSVEERVASEVFGNAGDDAVFESEGNFRFVVVDFPVVEVFTDEGLEADFLELL